jgi:hypothetical protein
MPASSLLPAKSCSAFGVADQGVGGVGVVEAEQKHAVADPGGHRGRLVGQRPQEAGIHGGEGDLPEDDDLAERGLDAATELLAGHGGGDVGRRAARGDGCRPTPRVDDGGDLVQDQRVLLASMRDATSTTPLQAGGNPCPTGSATGVRPPPRGGATAPQAC